MDSKPLSLATASILGQPPSVGQWSRESQARERLPPSQRLGRINQIERVTHLLPISSRVCCGHNFAVFIVCNGVSSHSLNVVQSIWMWLFGVVIPFLLFFSFEKHGEYKQPSERV